MNYVELSYPFNAFVVKCIDVADQMASTPPVSHRHNSSTLPAVRTASTDACMPTSVAVAVDLAVAVAAAKDVVAAVAVAVAAAVA